jgi:hypothetical protein
MAPRAAKIKTPRGIPTPRLIFAAVANPEDSSDVAEEIGADDVALGCSDKVEDATVDVDRVREVVDEDDTDDDVVVVAT